MERALQDYSRVIELAKDRPGGYYNRGSTYGQMGQFDAAIRDFSQALRLSPEDSDILGRRANAYFMKGAYEGALADYEQAYRKVPQDLDALNNVAWAFATFKDPKTRDGNRAVQLAEKLVAAEASLEHRDTLAAAYAEAGRFAEAVAQQKRAVEMLRSSGRVDEIASYEERLALYNAGKPSHE